MMPIKAVLFDLGGTLLHYDRPGVDFKALEGQGLHRVYHLLRHDGQPLPSPDTFVQVMNTHFQRIAGGGTQGNTDDALRSGLATMGIQLDAATWQVCIAALYEPITEIVQPIAGVREVMSTLHQAGYRLGLVSNTLWPAHLHDQHLRIHGLIDFLPVRMYSWQTGWRKPDPAIFRYAAQKTGVVPDETVFVGDRLANDVAGAHAAGMRAILVEVPFREEYDDHIRPDARLHNLSELPAVLAQWSEC